MLALETKQSGGKLLPHLDLQRGGVFLGETSCSRQKGMKIGYKPVSFSRRTLHHEVSKSCEIYI
jgi:hypothetical protein